MECNKDEALRSLDIAEKKFSVQDFAGAKKFVVKAQQLFPALEGAAQMLAVVEVHSTAQGRAPGAEHDWYGMLQVDPYADEATIRKQYRKLAFTLHPDKNKFVGAEAAFKLIGEAWTVLSDKDKRFAYNEKRGIKVQNMNFYQASQGVNGFNNSHQASSSVAASRPYSAATFWTVCPFCKMQYQYFRTYENYHLLCQKCKRGYVARDVNAMNGFPWSGTYGNFGSQVRPESLFTKFATSSKPGSFFSNGFVNGNAYSHMSSSATVSAGASATATASMKMTGANSSSGSAGPSVLTAEYVRQIYQKAKERVESEKEQKRKEKEREKQEREKEKEQRRNEREAQKKLREEEKKREALLKLLMKQKEMEEKEAARRKKADKSKTKSKKNESSDDSDDSDETDEDQFMEENEEDSDSLDRNVSNCHDAPSEGAFKVEPRRSSRTKRNISYRLDGSDDEDAEASQFLKRPKFETDAAESWRFSGCQTQIAFGGHVQNIQEMSSASGEVLSKAAKVDEPHKSELAGKFRIFLKEYVLPRLNEGKHLSGDNKAERDSRSLKICTATKTQAKNFCSNKKKIAKGDKSGNAAKKFKTKVKFCEPSAQSQCPPPEVHKPRNEEEIACKEHSDLDIPPPSSPKPGHTEASLEGMTVPDPDFHNFDADRTESKLSMGQLWAVYDDNDGMPRFYCRITRIISLHPFKVRVRWLDPDKSSEEVIKWVDSDHPLTCGELKLSNSYEIFEQINVFSHVILADVSQKDVIKIYPKKGEVWALYRGWSQEWFEQSSDGNERNYTYDMVEVASDFSEELGVHMILLVKVQGFNTLFEASALGESERLHCPPKEVFKFSHKVPAHKKSGAEAPNVPEGCWELDPASTPLELIYGQPSEGQGAK